MTAAIIPNRIRGPFWITMLTPEQSLDTCGPYRWVVTRAAMSHTAFKTSDGLIEWLRRTGLSVKFHDHSSWTAEGDYFQLACMDRESLDNLDGEVVPVLNNGVWTRGKLVKWEGVHAIAYCNPNVRDREVYGHRTITDGLDRETLRPIPLD